MSDAAVSSLIFNGDTITVIRPLHGPARLWAWLTGRPLVSTETVQIIGDRTNLQWFA